MDVSGEGCFSADIFYKFGERLLKAIHINDKILMDKKLWIF